MIALVKATDETPIYIKKHGGQVVKHAGSEGKFVQDTEDSVEYAHMRVRDSSLSTIGVDIKRCTLN